MHIASFVGRAEFVAHAKILHESLKRSGINAELTFVIPKERDFNISLLKVNIEEVNLECESRLFPFYDKILAAATFEQKEKYPFLWVDVDSLFLQGQDFSLPREGIRVNSVDHCNVGIKVGNDLSPLWQEVLEKVGLPTERYLTHSVLTSVSKEKIYAYYNMGMVYLNAHKGIFSTCAKILEHMLAEKEILELVEHAYVNRIFLHQMIFSAAVCRYYSKEEMFQLPEGCNVPMHMIANAEEEQKILSAKSIRYDTYFAQHKVPEFLKAWLGEERPDLSMRWYYE